MALSTFDLLQELSNSLQTASCLPQEPFMKLENGTAPILRYNLKQKSSFTSYGNFKVNLPDNYFLGSANEVPVDNFFDRIEGLTVEEVKTQIRKDLKRGDNNILQTLSGRTRRLEIAAETPDAPLLIENTGADTDEIATAVTNGKMPLRYYRMGKYKTGIRELQRPSSPKGTFFVIEEYTTASYLGDYGAGRTLRTFSLLPGEKTTMTVRTFEQITENKSRSENILDSFSEASTEEMENIMEEESNVSKDSSTSLGLKLDVSMSASISLTKLIGSVEGGTNISSSANHTANRASNVRTLGRALEKHVQSSNSNREVSISETSETSTTTEVEETTVRELINPNKSRVLNFVFRQLLQEYVTITYLSNIRIAFCNGYMETLKVVDLENIDALLEEYIEAGQLVNARNAILKNYCKIFNYRSQLVDFIEKIDVDYGSCLEGMTGTDTFWRIKPDLQDTYSDGGLDIDVRGVILNVQTHTLRTSSVVADSLLGQGEALDCFNSRLQDSAAMKTHLENAAMLQQMEIVDAIDDRSEKASAYKKVFGDCCASDVIVPIGTE